ncbi:secretagogin-like isoform 1-T1 [Spinachia spinachia]
MDRSLDAAAFLQIWQHFDVDDNGYIDGKQLDGFFRHMLDTFGMKTEETTKEMTEDGIRGLRDRFMSAFDTAADRRLQIQELAIVMLPEEENFLLLFRRETPLDNSVEFMRIWRSYDSDSSGYISATELKVSLQGFLQDLFLQHRKSITPEKLEVYTDAMMKMFDKNRDGRLDLNDLARILALKENFLLKFKMEACSQEDRKRDFEKIFAHYDISETGELEGPEVDGFVKDMMELVKPSISGTDLDQFRKALMGHCDINGDGKIQKNELALCLGLKLS